MDIRQPKKVKSKSQNSNFIPYEFIKIKDADIWRFYIDGYRQQTTEGIAQGSQLFDKGEPGYMQGMMKAHEYMCQTFTQPLTPELIINFHKIALTDVKNTSNRRLNKFRDKSSAVFGLVMNDGNDVAHQKSGNTSRQGMQEFLQSFIQNQHKEDFECNIVFNNLHSGGGIFNAEVIPQALSMVSEKGLDRAIDFLHEFISTGETGFVATSMTHEEIYVKVFDHIKQYEERIKSANSADEKLESIINLVQNLERLHPFSDGNCRTFAMLLLNRELIRQGFKPTMLDNPNRFDFFSVTELKKEIQLGWDYANKFQSDIASLPAFKKLYDQINIKDEDKILNQILTRIKDKSLDDAIIEFAKELKKFNKGGFANHLFGGDAKNYKLAQALLMELNTIQNLKDAAVKKRSIK